MAWHGLAMPFLIQVIDMTQPLNDAQAFSAFMSHVWEGGPLYDRYNDAIVTAQSIFGAVPIEHGP